MQPQNHSDLPKSSCLNQRSAPLPFLLTRQCTECGAPAAKGSRCIKYLVKARERQRRKRGLKRRCYNTLSYRLETAAQSRTPVDRRKLKPVIPALRYQPIRRFKWPPLIIY